MSRKKNTVYGFGEYREKLTYAKQHFPEELRIWLIELAEEVKGDAKDLTFVDTGELKRNWSISDIKRVGNTVQIEIFNSLHYAIYQEYGWRVKNTYTMGVDYVVPGRYMLTLSMKTIEQNMPERFKEFWERLGLT